MVAKQRNELTFEQVWARDKELFQEKLRRLKYRLIKHKHGSTKSEVKKIVAFGTTMIDDGSCDGLTWLCEREIFNDMKPPRERKIRRQRRTVHRSCIPVYTFRPKLRFKKKSTLDRKLYYTFMSRPKKIPQRKGRRIYRKLSPETKAKRQLWFEKNSRPKVIPKPPSPQKKHAKYTYEEMLPRLVELSRPKRIYIKTPPPDHVKRRESHKYKMTPRMEALAQPRALHPEYVANCEYNFDEKMEKALSYRISDRMKKLAEPKVRLAAHNDVREDAFTVNPDALRYKPTARILELAKPRDYSNRGQDWNPFAVKPVPKGYRLSDRMEELAKPKSRGEPPSNPWAFQVNPAALKYKATPRIIELSRPKKDAWAAKHNCFRDIPAGFVLEPKERK